MMMCKAMYTTGSRRGYIPVSVRGEESSLIPVPESLKGLRGNERKAMAWFHERGCTHYTMSAEQGCPSKGCYKTKQFCYTIYRGYKEV